jgi:hypothetical protein
MNGKQARHDARVDCVLARRLNVGTVAELDNGSIEIVFEGQVLRMAAGRYWTFMELMSEASRQLVFRASSA